MEGAVNMRVGEAAPLGGRPLVFSMPGLRAPASPINDIVVREEFDHVLDPEVQRVLVDFGGLNQFGGQNYRIVWGYRRGFWLGNQYYLQYTDRPRHKERWHLEKWCAPEHFGTPEQWYASAMMDVGGMLMNVLGPYPAEGDYIRVIVFENYHTGEFVKPEPDMVMEAIIRNRQHAEQSKLQIRDRIREEMAAKRKLTEDRKDEEIDKREAAFGLRSWIPVGGPTTPKHRRRDVWEPPVH